MTQLECEILKVINETIGGKYIGKLRVTKEDNIYCLAMFLNLTINPAFSLIKECKNDEEFKEFVRKEKKNLFEKFLFLTILRKISLIKNNTK